MLHRNLINRARFIVVFSCVLLVVVECSNPQVKCSKTCVADNCNSVGIRYGKFCGVGWTGCPGEKPCDDLDACCKTHDECVEKKGQTWSDLGMSSKDKVLKAQHTQHGRGTTIQVLRDAETGNNITE
ncbi:PREDICTED: phospholipase A2-gamma-like isoform X2 [Nelumbo nucifera]|uniref:Phospholipase A2-gamma-like isoform X2 n=1 Tax=Nelumbo nucifera TaxID=4432 RepID=A0A1U8AVP1_NELNU|nr:PREDICTED: phospholipase A2-gamma-like isoform X2 [Nelumbo nucifera]